MSAGAVLSQRAQEENWSSLFELAIREVFEIMLGQQVDPKSEAGPKVKGEFTAIVGLAGALCGIVTVCCSAETARQIANCMLGEAAVSEDHVADALGEVCNMVAGNFKNKLAGTDERCMLSVPSVISGGEYNFRSMADGDLIEMVLMLQAAPVAVRLQLHS